ncbi:signal transduction histidine kinase/CheY-like chemotaxis protein [Bradyrhizobium sp. USDA 4474]
MHSLVPPKALKSYSAGDQDSYQGYRLLQPEQVPDLGQMDRKWSIRRSLVFGGVGVVTVALLICAMGIYVLLYRPLVKELAASESRRAAVQVTADFETIFVRVEAIARLEREWGLKGLIDVDRLDASNALLRPLLKGTSGITSFAIARDDGREILISSEANGRWFNRLTDPDVRGGVGRFISYDESDRVVGDELRKTDYDARKRPWFLAAAAMPKDDNIHWTAAYRFVSSGEPGLSAVVRWTAPDGHRYAITSDVWLREITSFTQQVRFTNSGLAAILTDAGEALGLPRHPGWTSETVRKALLKPVDALGVAPLTASYRAWQARGRPSNEIIPVEESGNLWFASFHAVHPAGQTFWIATLAPSADFGWVGAGKLAIGAALVVGCITIASFAAIWFGTRIARPIEQLSAESERIGLMEFSRPINVASSVDEIDALARSLERMRSSFVQAQDELNSKAELERKLVQAQKMESVGQLTGGVAHDFNNMLTVILGTIEILKDGVAGNPELSAIAKMIDEAAKRGADLTHRLLAFSRLQPLQPRRTDVNALVIDVGRLLRPMLGDNVEIVSMLADDVWAALVDPSQLSNSLVNLAVNARDAMPAGGKLMLETENVQLDEDYASANGDVRPGPYVMIAVSDTGQGIPAAIRDKVFDPFFTTKHAGKGSGLGLSMVYGFVKQSNGHIKIYSEEGCGTTVRIYLPPAGEHDEGQARAQPVTQVERGTETILVVEDEALVRDYVGAQLRSLGYTAILASNAAEALARIEHGDAVDLLFTDVIMPGLMNGRHLADEAVRRRPGLKVLFSSGYTDNAIVHHGRLDPGVLLLAKPYLRSDLARMIRTALAMRTPDGDAAARPEPPGSLS